MPVMLAALKVAAMAAAGIGVAMGASKYFGSASAFTSSEIAEHDGEGKKKMKASERPGEESFVLESKHFGAGGLTKEVLSVTWDSPPQGSVTVNSGGFIKPQLKEKAVAIFETGAMIAVAAVAGVAFVGWGVYMFLGDGPETSSKRKTMKAPDQDFTIFRDVFESNPAAYFRDLRKKKKGSL